MVASFEDKERGVHLIKALVYAHIMHCFCTNAFDDME